MPDPTVAAALLLLVVLVEATPWIRLPLGLLLAIALLAADAELLPIALIGAVGVMIARLSLARAARSGRDRLGSPSPAAQAQRDTLRAHLAQSPAYARTTFVLAALPGVPAGFVFPLLGAMRAPLWPALAGTIIGRVPVLALTAAVFAWLGRLVSDGDDEAALLLGVLAVVLFAFRTLGRVDWQHRAATGQWRLRDESDPFVRLTTNLAGTDRANAGDAWPGRQARRSPSPDEDVVEGELLGEDDDEDPPPALPPSGATRS
jgi:membrane protein YqaA with SNARE-associated domain